VFRTVKNVSNILRHKFSSWESRDTKSFRHYINTLIRQSVDNGKLYDGKKRNPEWVTARVVKHLAVSFVTSCLQEGTVSWDVVVLRWMILVLQAALGCRAGDMVLSTRYHGSECVAWSDVSITLKDDPNPTVDSFQAVITLRFTKGNKYVIYLSGLFQILTLLQEQNQLRKKSQLRIASES
jgi:hypothetical protein